MKIKFYAKLYALPLGIVCACFLTYYFIFDSLNQYQQHIITITQSENIQDDSEIDEKARMREELEKIKQSSNADFIHNTLLQNINRISSYANIEFKNTKEITQTESEKKPKDNVTQTLSAIKVDKTNNPNYVSYRQIHTHELPNAFTSNINSSTDIKLYDGDDAINVKTIQVIQKNKKAQWVIPTTKEAKIYYLPSIQSKIIAINKNGIKMQVIDTKKSWVHIRYAMKKETFIEGYIPLRDIRFVN